MKPKREFLVGDFDDGVCGALEEWAYPLEADGVLKVREYHGGGNVYRLVRVPLAEVRKQAARERKARGKKANAE